MVCLVDSPVDAAAFLSKEHQKDADMVNPAVKITDVS